MPMLTANHTWQEVCDIENTKNVKQLGSAIYSVAC